MLSSASHSLQSEYNYIAFIVNLGAEEGFPPPFFKCSIEPISNIGEVLNVL